MNWAPSAVMMCVFKIIVTIVICIAGQSLMESFLAGVEGTPILHALGVVGGLMPAIGIGLNLRAILKKETFAFLLIGFLLVAYFQMPIVGVALLAIAFAAIYLFYNRGKEAEEYV